MQELNQVVEKNKKDLVNDDGIPPKVYIRCVSELEDVVNEAWKGKKNLKKLAAKGLTSLRSSMKKHNKEKVRTISRTSLSHAASVSSLLLTTATIKHTTFLLLISKKDTYTRALVHTHFIFSLSFLDATTFIGLPMPTESC